MTLTIGIAISKAKFDDFDDDDPHFDCNSVRLYMPKMFC